MTASLAKLTLTSPEQDWVLSHLWMNCGVWLTGGALILLTERGTPAAFTTAKIGPTATEFVAEMVGGIERPLRLLSLIPACEIAQDGQIEGTPLPAQTSLRDVLAQCLASGRDAVPVLREDGTQGQVTLAAIRARAQSHA